jgi:hypothetical protein
VSIPSTNQLFVGTPYCVIQRFSQYHTRVEQLPADERMKIARAAEFVFQSISEPQLTGGQVRLIGIRGHADADLQKIGEARLAFEKQISEERAKEVASALINAIKANAYKLNARSPPQGDPYHPVIQGVGATMLLNRSPRNESERAQNRRVEIFLLRDWISLLASRDFNLPPQKPDGFLA